MLRRGPVLERRFSPFRACASNFGYWPLTARRRCLPICSGHLFWSGGGRLPRRTTVPIKLHSNLLSALFTQGGAAPPSLSLVEIVLPTFSSDPPFVCVLVLLFFFFPFWVAAFGAGWGDTARCPDLFSGGDSLACQISLNRIRPPFYMHDLLSLAGPWAAFPLRPLLRTVLPPPSFHGLPIHFWIPRFSPSLESESSPPLGGETPLFSPHSPPPAPQSAFPGRSSVLRGSC